MDQPQRKTSVGGKGSWLLFFLPFVGFQLLAVLNCQEEKVIQVDRGIRTLKQVDHIPVSSIPELSTKQGLFSRSNQPFLTFTHGEPKWTELAGVDSENQCHSYMRTEFALALVCQDVIYLLD